MSPEAKIDLSTYNGPMTVVGYPDLSIIKAQSLGVHATPGKLATGVPSGSHSEHKTSNPRRSK